jgi:hypothetical protein
MNEPSDLEVMHALAGMHVRQIRHAPCDTVFPVAYEEGDRETDVYCPECRLQLRVPIFWVGP